MGEGMRRYTHQSSLPPLGEFIYSLDRRGYSVSTDRPTATLRRFVYAVPKLHAIMPYDI